jgi:hypothetical protein
MKTVKLYRYVGRNGSVTTPVLLDDIKHYVYYRLSADENKMLTDGNQIVYAADVPEEEVHLWKEIEEEG